MVLLSFDWSYFQATNTCVFNRVPRATACSSNLALVEKKHRPMEMGTFLLAKKETKVVALWSFFFNFANGNWERSFQSFSQLTGQE